MHIDMYNIEVGTHYDHWDIIDKGKGHMKIKTIHLHSFPGYVKWKSNFVFKR